MSKTKIPASWPTYTVKCMWRATAITLRIRAKDRDAAWDKASKMVMKMFGGMGCLDIKVLGETDG